MGFSLYYPLISSVICLSCGIFWHHNLLTTLLTNMFTHRKFDQNFIFFTFFVEKFFENSHGHISADFLHVSYDEG